MKTHLLKTHAKPRPGGVSGTTMRSCSYIFLLAIAALLTLGTGCSEKEEIMEDPTIKSETKPTPDSASESKLKPIIPESDPTAGFSGRGMEDYIMDPGPTYYDSFVTICNASSHLVYLRMEMHSLAHIASFKLRPGEKDIVDISMEDYWGVKGELIKFHDFERIHFYFGQPSSYYTRDGIYDDEMTDFTIQSDAANPCDESQWYYEEFNPHLCRWTYIITDQDYERAKQVSKNRTYDNDWPDWK